MTKVKDAAGAAESQEAKKGIDLSRFDYGKNVMQGEDFKAYMEMQGTLLSNEKYDFEIMKVNAIKDVRYEDVANSPVDIVGFRIIDNQPLMTTRISAKHAVLANGRLRSGKNFFTVEGGQWYENGGNPAVFGRFYRLKKVEG